MRCYAKEYPGMSDKRSYIKTEIITGIYKYFYLIIFIF
jgi:hypothetical protein